MKDETPTTVTDLPDVLIDDYGYPTQEWLQYIKQYSPDYDIPILEFAQIMAISGWWMPDWGVVVHKKYKGKYKFELHTGGWSGNEDIIDAIKSNIYLTHFSMNYVMWKIGGHYYFEISA
jgi:hypothetical protein